VEAAQLSQLCQDLEMLGKKRSLFGSGEGLLRIEHAFAHLCRVLEMFRESAEDEP
jgi:hypothetical protein